MGREIGLHRNFETMYWPYWNNAHHMIPKGTLNSMIESVPDDARLANLIRAGLLKGLYNVNHYENVILLPMDKEVGIHLQLPRHLSLDDESDAFDEAPKFNHVAYNAKVETRLDTILQRFMEIASEVKAGEVPCEMKEMSALAKADLITLSQDCYVAIVALGKSKPGKPLVDLPSLPRP
ncbi:AHH domain-containing protein [Myxococcus sp. QH3KD-4-1]|nr:AHH domain-containing protein [Myxococcus qinghaiensis]